MLMWDNQQHENKDRQLEGSNSISDFTYFRASWWSNEPWLPLLPKIQARMCVNCPEKMQTGFLQSLVFYSLLLAWGEYFVEAYFYPKQFLLEIWQKFKFAFQSWNFSCTWILKFVSLKILNLSSHDFDIVEFLNVKICRYLHPNKSFQNFFETL